MESWLLLVIYDKRQYRRCPMCHHDTGFSGGLSITTGSTKKMIFKGSPSDNKFIFVVPGIWTKLEKKTHCT